MPDVVNSLLQTIDQTNGGNPNTWGDIVDANFLKIENAIAGSNTNTSSSGTVGLTVDQQRPMFQFFSGALSGDLIIEVAATSKAWIVWNRTSGSFKLTLRVTGGAGAAYVVPRGMPHLVFCDGANVYGATGSRSRFMTGLTLSAGGGSNQFTVSAGDCTADAAPYSPMSLAPLLIKTAGAWTAGTANGSLDTGAVTNNTWYYPYLIAKLDGTTDVITSLSSTAPLLPSGYVNYRRLGALLTDDSGNWIKFKQVGAEFLWDGMIEDLFHAPLGGSSQLWSLSVPPVTGVKAFYRAHATNAFGASAVLFTSPDEGDQPAGGSSGQVSLYVRNTSDHVVGEFTTRTVGGQIRATASLGSTAIDLATFGWVDTLLRAGG